MKKVLQISVLSTVILATPACHERVEPASSETGPSRLAALLRADPADGFALAAGPRVFTFPADHGPHPAFRNEWWYVTGNVDDPSGRRFGYELTLFRFALAPPAATPANAASRWHSRELFVGHFALSDVAAGRFHVAERFSRGALGLAGAEGSPVRVWLEDWSLSRHEEPARGRETWRLMAAQQGVSVALTLEPQIAPVLNGEGGLSQKSAEPGNASYYYSVPRLRTRGTIAVGDSTYPVSGWSWLDREWGSRGLSAGQRGWDWFGLQLDDGSNLMFYQLRRVDGTPDPASAGTWIPAEGEPRALGSDDLSIDVRGYWTSPRGGRYPLGWTLRLPAAALTLDVEPVLDAQELDTRVRYWEGAVDVSGDAGERPVSGRGYVELTGYAADSP